MAAAAVCPQDSRGDHLPDLKIRPEVAEINDFLVETRRRIHRHPELSFVELDTAKFIAELLRSWGLEVKMGLGSPQDDYPGTGVVADLKGALEGPCIALRADMDALPVKELTGLSFASENDGKMHACGHDVHMASLLGAARILAGMKDKIRGSVRFIFQPAEECGGGAKYMIRDGCMEGVDEIYGIHVWSPDTLGAVGLDEGPVMSCADIFTVTIVGEGGHGACPHETIDPVFIQAQLINAFQSIVSRNTPPLEATVVTVGKIEEGGFAPNVIPTRFTFSGTLRSFSERNRDMLRERVRTICRGYGIAYECEISVEYQLTGLKAAGYPPVINTREQVAKMRRACNQIVGDHNTRRGPLPCMASEDFSYYQLERPGCFLFVGGQIPDGKPRPHHSSFFDVDERTLAISASIWLQLVEDQLIQPSSQQ